MSSVPSMSAWEEERALRCLCYTGWTLKKQPGFRSAAMQDLHSSSPLAKHLLLGHVFAMSLESVRAFFAAHAPDIEVILTEESSATVALAAAAHGVEPDQIAKTICVRAGEMTALVVMSGLSRLDNRKFRERFGAKPRMLGGDEVVAITGHPVGGVCPFGTASPLPVYCDVSLRKYSEVLPAAGAVNAAVRIAPDHMVDLTGATWVDVGQDQSLNGNSTA